MKLLKFVPTKRYIVTAIYVTQGEELNLTHKTGVFKGDDQKDIIESALQKWSNEMKGSILYQLPILTELP